MTRHGATVHYAERIIQQASSEREEQAEEGGDGAASKARELMGRSRCYAVTRDGPGVEDFYQRLPNPKVRRASWFWVQCVLGERTFCRPSIQPRLFTPQPHPIRPFHDDTDKPSSSPSSVDSILAGVPARRRSPDMSMQ